MSDLTIEQLLTPELLENDHKEYFTILKKCFDDNIDISHILNDTSYHKAWYSPHATCLSYLVGEYVDNQTKYYGYNIHTGISNSFGIQILDLMIKNGADLKIKNYYGQNIYESLEACRLHECATLRRYNKEFVEKVKSLM